MLKQLANEQFEGLVAEHRLWLDTKSDAFSCMTVRDTSISGLTMQAESLMTARFSDCVFSSCVFRNVDFSDAEIVGCSFHACQFAKCNFFKSDLKESLLVDCSLHECNLTRADLTDASFRRSTISECVLDHAWIVGTDLSEATFQGASFRGARLVGANIERAIAFELTNSDFALVKDAIISSDPVKRIQSAQELVDYLARRTR
jgi:uncharacterized protein YjbI with pentapeptide repeats